MYDSRAPPVNVGQASHSVVGRLAIHALSRFLLSSAGRSPTRAKGVGTIESERENRVYIPEDKFYTDVGPNQSTKMSTVLRSW